MTEVNLLYYDLLGILVHDQGKLLVLWTLNRQAKIFLRVFIIIHWFIILIYYYQYQVWFGDLGKYPYLEPIIASLSRKFLISANFPATVRSSAKTGSLAWRSFVKTKSSNQAESKALVKCHGHKPSWKSDHPGLSLL